MKKYTPLDGLRWSRDSDSALNNMPQTDVLGRAGGVLAYPSALERTSIELLGMRGITIKTTSSGNKQD